jgi:hypothetical protein
MRDVGSYLNCPRCGLSIRNGSLLSAGTFAAPMTRAGPTGGSR